MTIELGDKVRCKHTGFTGIAVAKIEYINGCTQYAVLPKVKAGEKYPEDVGIDDTSLEVVTKKKKTSVTKKKKPIGGATKKVSRMRGF